MDKIDDLRQQIDQLDDLIMELLDKRYEVTKKVGEVKKAINKDVFDPSREEYILKKTSKYSHSPQIKDLYKYLMNVSKDQQRK